MSLTLHTSHGDIKIELFCELCPKTCKNFLALCGKKYYDNTIFHRNIKGFIILGGDPTGIENFFFFLYLLFIKRNW